jgi:PTH1 family peptidyl-tRNA hydrolase
LWAVVGLGNPGKRYVSTRHNVGFRFVKSVAKEWEIELRKRRCLSKTAMTERGGEQIFLALPQTYMNRSGEAVKRIVDSRGVGLDHLLVVYDDLDIALGEIRIRKSGGPGTHKGMSSIVNELQTVLFPRIRIGIGPLAKGMSATEFVLSPFEEEERYLLEEGMVKARSALGDILEGNIEAVMARFN